MMETCRVDQRLACFLTLQCRLGSSELHRFVSYEESTKYKYIVAVKQSSAGKTE